MPSAVLTHLVHDPDHWLETVSLVPPAAIGATAVRTFICPGDPSKVGVLFEFPETTDPRLLITLMSQRPEMIQILERAGVILESVEMYVER